MKQQILFISDLHLDPEQPATVELFLEFLKHRAASAEALYILGDMFEMWLGDDAILPSYHPILDALRNLTNNGVALHVMRGNRDFLLGNEFCSLTGANIIDDPYMLVLGNIPTLLMHGDLLCTDDVTYQKFRSQVRNPIWQKKLFGMSLEERLNLGRQLRQQSYATNIAKSAEIMDVNQSAVEKTMCQHGASQLIHGHTHRPAKHSFTINGQPATRFVLPEWNEQQGGMLLYDGQELYSEPYPYQSITT